MKKKSDIHPKRKIKNYFTSSGKTKIDINQLARLLGLLPGRFNERLDEKKAKKDTVRFDLLAAIYTVSGITP